MHLSEGELGRLDFDSNQTIEKLIDNYSFSLDGKFWDENNGKVSIEGFQDLPKDWTFNVISND